MGIDAYCQDELGGTQAGVPDPQMLLSDLVRAEKAATTSLIRFIDPYGDTTFNQLQVPTLLAELMAARDWDLTDEQRLHLDRVIQLVRQAEHHPHTYVKFVGD